MSFHGNSMIPTDDEHDAHYANKSRRRVIAFGDWSIEYRLTEDAEVDEVYSVKISQAGADRLNNDREKMLIDFVDTLFKADCTSIYEFLASYDAENGADA
jgi:hypothetical protein